MTARILLARHAQSEDNLAGILGGRRDSVLTPLGILQAQEAARYLQQKGIRPIMVYSSTALRAQQTSEIITSTLNTSTAMLKRDLQERDMGILTGMTKSEALKVDTGGIIIAGKRSFARMPKNGESFPELCARAKRVLGSIIQTHDTGVILVVTHCVTSLMIFAEFYGLDWEDTLKRFHFGNANLVWLDNSLRPQDAVCFQPS